MPQTSSHALRNPLFFARMEIQSRDEFFMNRALELARRASDSHEVPVGALIIFESEIISEAWNLREASHDPTAHAELLAIQKASQKLGRWRLTGCTLYATLEPCLMCAGALILSRLERVVYGARDPKGGAVHSLYETLGDVRLNHRPQVTFGINEKDCGKILSDFFARKRKT